MREGNKLIGKITHAHSTPIATGSYTELDAVLSDDVSHVEIFDSSGEALVIAFGAAGSEDDQFYVMPGGNGRIPLLMNKGIRISAKAIGTATASGNLYINMWG